MRLTNSDTCCIAVLISKSSLEQPRCLVYKFCKAHYLAPHMSRLAAMHQSRQFWYTAKGGLRSGPDVCFLFVMASVHDGLTGVLEML